MKRMNMFYTVALAATFSIALNAQDDNDDVHDIVVSVPEVALVDIEASGGTSINLGPAAPTEAGLPLDFSGQSNSDLWLNYSSIKSTANDPTRDITALISGGTLPSGMSLDVTAAADAGNGDGAMGSSAGAVTLSASNQNVITGIGSAYTADGVSNGHNLTYALALSGAAGAYAALDADNANTVQITYTITDN
ncbi:MAG: hypothetical protein U5L96_08075 [Owenweeksia sp.]|nr:hypothetical protein [Owenweeksia sp.]